MTAGAGNAESGRGPDAGVISRAGASADRIGDRIVAGANEMLQHVRIAATTLLDGPLEPERQHACAQRASELAVWLGSMGLNAEANLARALEALFVGGPATASDAVEAAGLIDDIRHALAASVADDHTAAAATTSLLVIGEQTRRADSYVWIGSRSGFACSLHPPEAHPASLPADRVDLVLVLASADMSVALLRALAERYPLAPILGLVDDDDPAADHFHDWCATVLSGDARPDEVTTELWWLHSRANQSLTVATVGQVSAGFSDLVDRVGGRVLAFDNTIDRIDHRAEGGLDAVVIGPDVSALQAEKLARRARSVPELRKTIIVRTTREADSGTRAELYRLGVDAVVTAATGPTNDELFAHVRALTLRAQRFSTSDGGAHQVLGRTSAQIVAERILVSAHRDNRAVSIAVVQLPVEMEEGALDSAVESLAGDFRNHDVVGRWDNGHLLVALRGVPRATGVRRIASALDRYGLASEGARAGIAEFPYDAQGVDELASLAMDVIERSRTHGGPVVAGSDWRPGGSDTPDIMIIDPDTMLAEVLASHLEDRGNTVVTLGSGIDAVDWLLDKRRSPPRLLLLEFHVPGADGTQVLRQLRKAGVLHRTRVVMLSASTRDQDLVDAYELGALDVISKPFSMVVFNNRVKRILES